MKKLLSILVAIWHFMIMLLGGIIVCASIKRPKLLMLLNRIIIILFVAYKIHGYITYGR